MFNRLILWICCCLLGSWILQSCGVCTSKQYSCESELDSLAHRWIHIDSGQQLIFTYNSLRDTATIHPYFASTSTTASSGSYNSPQRPCKSNLNARSIEKDSQGNYKVRFQYEIETYYPGKSQLYGSSFIAVKGATFWIANISHENGITSFTDSTQLVNNFTSPNGITYSKVSILTKDTTNMNPNLPYKLYIAYMHGIIGYEIYPSHQLWTVLP